MFHIFPRSGAISHDIVYFTDFYKFIADLNNDGTNEVIIQEVKEFEAKYDIIEFKNDNFIEVLSSELKFK